MDRGPYCFGECDVCRRLENQQARSKLYLADENGDQDAQFPPNSRIQRACDTVFRIGRMLSDLRRDPEGDDANTL